MIDAIKYMNLVKKEARIISKLRRMNEDDHSDLVAQGNLILCECVERFHPDMGIDFSVYLRRALDYSLNRYVRKGFQRYVNENNFAGDLFSIDQSFQSIVLSEALETMRESAQFCVSLVLTPPNEILTYQYHAGDGAWGRKMTRHTVRKYLRDKGWYGCQITSAFREIQDTLNHIQ